jgi:UDP-GlcNAc3NAcA epimerase
MIKIITVIGARPQIIKASAISRAIRNSFASQIHEIIVHTGQHYDETMSKVFFEELNVPKEDYNLQVGSGSHAFQTGHMMIKLEEIFLIEKPQAILLYGDTNSTLAAAVAASKLHIPVIHIEGGVRSYNKKFPEEVNRLICDHLSTLIFVPTISGIDSLSREGLNRDNSPPFTMNNAGVFHCGDIMYDNSIFFGIESEERTQYFQNLNVLENEYALVTMHRPSNVDEPKVLANLLHTFLTISNKYEFPLIFPIHPRTLKIFEEQIETQLKNQILNSRIKLIPPASFIEMTLLEKKTRIIMTDSGGVQKEAYYFRKPCIILLEETPWIELVDNGTAKLVGSVSNKIVEAFDYFINSRQKFNFPPIFGDGKAAEFICDKIIDTFKR